jgi:hypothetical protein
VLVDQWKTLGSELPEGWSSVEVTLHVEQREQAEDAARLLGPAQPYRLDRGDVRFRVARDGTAPSPDGIQRLLRGLDRQHIAGRLELGTANEQQKVVRAPEQSLVAAWEEQLAHLPADWSDVFAEIELRSTDYVERASLLCVPMNPRLDRTRTALQFRCAARFGYGASKQMVRRCLERCDADGIRGSVRVLRVLSDTDPVGTQGPVWLAAGRTL